MNTELPKVALTISQWERNEYHYHNMPHLG